MVRFHPFSSSQTVSLPEGNHMEHVNLVFTESIQVLYLKPCGNTSGWIENPPNLGKMDAVFFLKKSCMLPSGKRLHNELEHHHAIHG